MTESMLNLQGLCFEYFSFLKREVQGVSKGKITATMLCHLSHLLSIYFLHFESYQN